MRVTSTVVLALITGIFSFTNAAEWGIEKSCLENGGFEAFTNLKNKVEKMSAYFNSMQADFTQALQGEKAEDAIALMCNKDKYPLEDLLKEFTESFKLCLEIDLHESLNLMYKSEVKLLRFGCENTELLGKAITSPELQCAISKMQAVQSCENFDVSTISDLREPCNKILAFQQCTIELMQQCNDDVFVELLDSLWKSANNDLLDCKILPKSSTSDASPTSVISFMILFISLMQQL